MKQKINILIYPGNNPIALNVYESLKDMVLFKPYVGTSKEDFDALLIENYIGGIPFIFDENFVEKLNEKLKEFDIKYIFPMHDTVALFLKKIESSLLATVVCSPVETCEICRYKSKTYMALKDEDFVPKFSLQPDEVVDFPVFIKDDIGQGGKNSYVINDKKELDEVVQRDKDINYVFCEYLTGKEVTVDCFTDGKGELLVVSPRVRLSTIDGKCSRGQTIKLTDEIRRIAQSINQHIRFRGGWFFQCKQDNNGKYKLMEVSTRLAGTHGISRQLDINFAALALYDLLGYQNLVVQPNDYTVYHAKTYKEGYKIDYEFDAAYFDFDDTLVVDKSKYIPKTFALLLQLKNQGKEVHLITRHDSNIYDTLHKLHIDRGLFDSIIQLDSTQEKYECIDTSKKCVFIDNSFNERIKIKQKLGVPTFDVSNIDALYDSFN